MSNNAPEFVITTRDAGDSRVGTNTREVTIVRMNLNTQGGGLSVEVTIKVNEPDEDILAAILRQMKKSGLWTFNVQAG